MEFSNRGLYLNQLTKEKNLIFRNKGTFGFFCDRFILDLDTLTQNKNEKQPTQTNSMCYFMPKEEECWCCCIELRNSESLVMAICFFYILQCQEQIKCSVNVRLMRMKTLRSVTVCTEKYPWNNKTSNSSLAVVWQSCHFIMTVVPSQGSCSGGSQNMVTLTRWHRWWFPTLVLLRIDLIRLFLSQPFTLGKRTRNPSCSLLICCLK